MEMYLSLESPFLCAGENNSRVIKLHGSDAELNGSVRLAFVTPGGKKYLTPELAPDELSNGYKVPFAVLDRYGRLLAQIVVIGENGECKKSDVCAFEVRPEIGENSTELDDGELITLAQVNERLKAVEELLAGLVPISSEEIDEICDEEAGA